MIGRLSPGLLAAGVLVVVGAALAWVVAMQVVRFGSETVATAAIDDAAPASLDLPGGTGLPTPSKGTLAEVVERPVFSPTRRPPPGQATAAGSSSARPQTFDLELTGVVVTGVQKVALVLPKGSAQTVQLKEGDTYRGWTVDEIGPGFMVLRSRGRKQVVHLSYRPQSTPSKRE
jgi:hypothetical protein